MVRDHPHHPRCLGADVGHAAPGSMLPSISGVVSSVDQHAARYVASSRIQVARTERIVDLKEMMLVSGALQFSHAPSTQYTSILSRF